MADKIGNYICYVKIVSTKSREVLIFLYWALVWLYLPIVSSSGSSFLSKTKNVDPQRKDWKGVHNPAGIILGETPRKLGLLSLASRRLNCSVTQTGYLRAIARAWIQTFLFSAKGTKEESTGADCSFRGSNVWKEN